MRRVLEDPDDDFSSSDDEIVGDLKVGEQVFVWTEPGNRRGGQSEIELCLMESALLNDEEVGEVSKLSLL